MSFRKLNRVEAWLTRHIFLAFGVVAVAMIAAAVVLLLLLAEERTKLSGVHKAGPCRSSGIKDPECRLQARLILAACADQPARCARVFGLTVVRAEENISAANSGELDREHRRAAEAGEGVIPQPPSSHPTGQQPGPGSQPGPSVGGHPHPHNPGSPPASPPAPPAPTDPTGTPTPPDEPGSSEQTPSGKGVKACVDLAVSACVEAGLE